MIVIVRIGARSAPLAVAGVRLRYALKDTIIMPIPMMLVLAALIVWPDVRLFLPRLLAPNMLKWRGEALLRLARLGT